MMPTKMMFIPRQALSLKKMQISMLKSLVCTYEINNQKWDQLWNLGFNGYIITSS